MSDTAAEPNSVIQFSLLRRGADQPAGPYSESDILDLLRRNEIDRKDFVFYEGMDDWAAIDEVFDIQEQLSHFVDDGQDKKRVGEAFREVSEILAAGEDIYYIATQEKSGLLSKGGKCAVVLTNKRLLLMSDKRHGFELESIQWSSISNTLMRDEGKGSGTFSVLLQLEKRTDVTHIPISQVHRLFKLSQELKDQED